MSQILYGAPVAQDIYQQLVADFDTSWTTPHLTILQVGQNSASSLYIQKKAEALEELGGKVTIKNFDKNCSTANLCNFVEQLNQDSSVNGILIQLPLPRQIDTSEVLRTVDPQKDVDGLTPTNIGLITHGMAGTPAATPQAVMKILEYYSIKLKGKHVAIINNSILLGKPLSPLLSNQKATVTICHKDTKDIRSITQAADIIVSATGKPFLVDETYLASDSILIDVGISRKDNKVVGDFSPGAIQKSTAYTPVPGGIGPITVACLVDNLYRKSTYQKK